MLKRSPEKMLLSETDIEVQMLYMGPGNGCRKILRCDQVGFKEQIDCSDEHTSKLNLLDKLDCCVHEKFVKGEFSFDSTKQDRALSILALPDTCLLDRAFPEDEFERCFTRMELERWSLFDFDLYNLGLYGDESTKAQAVELLKQVANKTQHHKSDRAGGSEA